MKIENLKIEMAKLEEGSRLIRVTDPELGVSLEKKANPSLSIAKQKDQLVAALIHLIESKLLAAA
jgi:hypothetical protein